MNTANKAAKITREEWLVKAAILLNKDVFKRAGQTMDGRWRVTCGWPITGGARSKNRTIGECWSTKCSADKSAEISISPAVDYSMRVLDILAHEMIHAIVGTDAGHRKPFVDLMKKIGLTGKPTATEAGPELIPELQKIVDKLGPYPHAKLTAANRKKQGTRMLKAICEECGYTVRLTRKWAEVGTPLCPCNKTPMMMEGPNE